MWVTPLVFSRRRPHRRHPELTCTCQAVSWPHRLGSVPGCYGRAFCHHGRRTGQHPDGAEFCPHCSADDWHAWADEQRDLRCEFHHI